MSTNILNIFDSSDIDSITALIDKLEQSSFEYLKLESNGVKIVIGKNGFCETADTGAATTEAPVKSASDAARTPAIMPEPATPPEPATLPDTKPAEAVLEQEGIVLVKAPSYGLFYAQPEPGSPPYVRLGDTVQIGETLGLLEIMKTFSAISSDVAGEVVRIHVVNEQVLEPDQPLFSIKVR